MQLINNKNSKILDEIALDTMANLIGRTPTNEENYELGGLPSIEFPRDHRLFFLKAGIKSPIEVKEQNLLENRITTLPILYRALNGDRQAQKQYEVLRLIPVMQLPSWITKSAKEFASSQLSSKSWNSLFDVQFKHEVAKALKKSSETTLSNLIDGNDRIPVSELIREVPSKIENTEFYWLGLVNFNSYYRYNRYIELAESRASIRKVFSSIFYLLRISANLAFKKTIPNYALTSIYHPGQKAEFLRSVGKKTANYILAANIIEDFCYTQNIPLTEEQKRTLANKCWKNTWDDIWINLGKRAEVLKLFIEEHQGSFRSDTERSRFFIDALMCSSLPKYLSDTEFNFSKRKRKSDPTSSNYGRDSAIKNFFIERLKIIQEFNLNPTFSYTAKDLLYLWRTSTTELAEELCDIISSSPAVDLNQNFENWKAKFNNSLQSDATLDEDKKVNARVDNDVTSDALPDLISLSYKLNDHVTPFYSSYLNLLSKEEPSVIRAVNSRLQKFHEGHFGDSKRIKTLDNVMELRIHVGAGWRIYVTRTSADCYSLLEIAKKEDQKASVLKLNNLIHTATLT